MPTIVRKPVACLSLHWACVQLPTVLVARTNERCQSNIALTHSHIQSCQIVWLLFIFIQGQISMDEWWVVVVVGSIVHNFHEPKNDFYTLLIRFDDFWTLPGSGATNHIPSSPPNKKNDPTTHVGDPTGHTHFGKAKKHPSLLALPPHNNNNQNYTTNDENGPSHGGVSHSWDNNCDGQTRPHGRGTNRFFDWLIVFFGSRWKELVNLLYRNYFTICMDQLHTRPSLQALGQLSMTVFKEPSPTWV
jgi:hypothetical protein